MVRPQPHSTGSGHVFALYLCQYPGCDVTALTDTPSAHAGCPKHPNYQMVTEDPRVRPVDRTFVSRPQQASAPRWTGARDKRRYPKSRP